MKNTLKIFGISVMVFTILLTMGAGILAEELKEQLEDDPTSQEIMAPEDETPSNIEEPTAMVEKGDLHKEEIVEKEEPVKINSKVWESNKHEVEESVDEGQIPERRKLREHNLETTKPDETNPNNGNFVKEVGNEGIELPVDFSEPPVDPDELLAEPDIPVDGPVEKALDSGKLTIKLKLDKGRPEDTNREFDFFVYGPEGTKYTMSLTPNSSITIEGLKYGKYEIKEIVPADYKVKGPNTVKVTLSAKESNKKIVIINKRKKLGGLYHYNEKKNSFKVGF